MEMPRPPIEEADALPPRNDAPDDFLQQHMRDNLGDGVRNDYSDLLPPGIRERPQHRDPGRSVRNLNHLVVGGAIRQQPMSPQQNLQEQFEQAMQQMEHMCIICGEEPERLMATCCGAMICNPCLDKCELYGLEKCSYCREIPWDAGFIDVANAYRVYHKVGNVLEEKAAKELKVAPRTVITHYIESKLQQLGKFGQEGEEEKGPPLREGDRKWL